MDIILGILIVGLVAVLVGYPLFSPAKGGEIPENGTGENEMALQKEAVFSTINEIEFEYQMKKLSDQDYAELKERFEQSAIALLKKEEERALAKYARPKRTMRLGKGRKKEGDLAVGQVSLEAIDREIEELIRKRQKEIGQRGKANGKG